MRLPTGLLRVLAGIALVFCASQASASVFYKFIVAAETPTGGFTGFGNGPSINDKGKAAFIGQFGATGHSVMLWTPVGGVTNIAPSLLSPNRSFGDGVRINSNDEVGTWNRLLPLGLYEMRVFRSATPDDSSIMVRGLSGGSPYEILYQFPTINANRVLEDRRTTQPGDKDGVCDAGEVCVSQVVFNAVRSVPQRFLGTVVQNPTDASDLGVQNEFGMNTSQSRPAMADDGRIVVRGLNATDPILLFNYTLGAPSTIAGSATGFTALGRAPGITSDGKVIAFAANRGKGDGVFLSIQLPSGTRRVVRIVGENAVVQKAELGVDGANSKLYFTSIELDSRVGVVYTPDRFGTANKSVVVSFIGTPNGASRTNPGTGNPFLFSAQKGLWTIRIDLESLHQNMCVVRVPGVVGNPFTLLGDDQLVALPGGTPHASAGNNGYCETENSDVTETLFSRSSPLPVVQIGDTIKSAAVHTVSGISVNDPIAAANFDSALVPRAARNGDHRVVFHAQVDAGAAQMIVVGEHLDSDQDGLMDHWETTGIDLDGDGGVDLDLAAMGANPFARDLFMQIDWTADRPPPLNLGDRHRPVAGVMRKLAQFYASAPALPNGVPAGIQLHVDAGTGRDPAQQFFSRNMGIGPLVGGQTVAGGPVDILYGGLPGSVTFPGVTAVSFDTVKSATFWNHHRGAREFAFMQIVMADFHHGQYDNVNPIRGTAAQGSSFEIEDNGGMVTPGNFSGSAIKITGGTGAGQLRAITSHLVLNANGHTLFQVTPAWTTIPDATSTYMLFDRSSGEGHASFRYDGAFLTGKNLAVTLGTYPRGPNNETGSFTVQFQSFDHEVGHLISLMHGGVDHVLYKPNYVSVMNYAYQFCPFGLTGRDASGTALPGAAACPVEGYSGAADAISNNWRNVDLRFSTNFHTFGHAFGAAAAQTVTTIPSDPAPSLAEIAARFGPLDVRAPATALLSPAGGAAFALGAAIAVSYNATDAVGVTRGEVIFDVNGDGAINETTEIFVPAFAGPSSFSTTLPAVSGPNGSRTLTVIAYDAAGNPGIVNVTVNVGSVAPVTVPNVVGQTIDAATTTLTTASLAAGPITLQQSGSVAAGAVISQNPAAGQSRPPGTAVSLVKSLGNNGVATPDVAGLSQAAAMSAINAAGLVVGTVTQTITVAPPGVIAQTPLAGAIVASGALVHLLVSSSGTVTVPNVVGQTQAAATNAITGVGLTVGVVTQATSPTVPAGSVISQLPAAGASVASGSAVDLVVSLGPPCSAFSDVASSSPFCANVEWLKNRSITLGCTGSSYCPGAAVTRLAMAAFMNRLGTALTAPSVVKSEPLGSVVVGAGNVACATSDYAVTGFPRRAYVDAVFAGTAAVTTEFGADLVASFDAGTSWQPLSANGNRATIRPFRWTNVRATGDVDLAVGQTVRFGVRMTHGGVAGTATLTDARCQVRALFGNRNGAASPFDDAE